MYLETKDTVIASDLHGNVNKLEKLAEIYDGVRIILNGDSIDGGNTSRFLQVAGEIGVLMNIGNHEWVLAACMQEQDEDSRQYYLGCWRPNSPKRQPYEHGLLKSYGVSEKLNNKDAADKLYGIMWRSGHLDLLNSMQTYYETDDFIALHAGLVSNAWEEQRDWLDVAKHDYDKFDYSNPPINIFDYPNYRLSNWPDDFAATKKTVLTGHSHLKAKTEERVSSSGRRVRLASHLAVAMPMYVWQSWDRQLVEL